jgi:hypothetical protein
MYVFSRFRPSEGTNNKAIHEGLIGVADMVRDVTGISVYVWQAQYHPSGNGWVSSCRVDSPAELETAWAAMANSSELAARMESIAGLMPHPPVDSLDQVVAGTLGEQPARLVNITTARASNGQQQKAVTWGAELSARATEAIDVPVVFMLGAYGDYGTMKWLAGYETAADMDAARGKLMASETVRHLIDEGGEYVQTDAFAFMLRRVH